jgi:hypothetical protein
MEKHYLHFNAAALVDAAQGYKAHLAKGRKMMVTLAGAMSTAELGKIFAEMIRQGKVDIISCTGANLEEDVMNLVAHDHYERVPQLPRPHPSPGARPVGPWHEPRDGYLHPRARGLPALGEARGGPLDR